MTGKVLRIGMSEDIVRFHLGWEGERSILYKGWKLLPSIRILKNLSGSPKEKAQKGQYLLAVDLGCHKWYQSQTLGDVLVRRLSPEGKWTQGSVPTRRLGPTTNRLENGTSANEDAEP